MGYRTVALWDPFLLNDVLWYMVQANCEIFEIGLLLNDMIMSSLCLGQVITVIKMISMHMA